MIGKFLDFIEIKTKITSVFAFFMTTALLLYSGQGISPGLTSVFFFSMFLFDLTTTAINNYIDTKTDGQTLQIDRNKALAVIIILFVSSTSLGLYLAYLTDIVVLSAGMMCFLCGVLYTWGPVPISRQPLGEILSGVFYGFFIPFILVYINTPAGTLMEFGISSGIISLRIAIVPVAAVCLFSLVPVCTTANIMLANNICDLKRDAAVKRYTLPYYLGKEKSLVLFRFLYYTTYGAAAIMVVLKILPTISLLILLTIFPVQKNINKFSRIQNKKTTFVTAIENYIIIMGVNTILIFAGIFINYYL